MEKHLEKFGKRYLTIRLTATTIGSVYIMGLLPLSNYIQDLEPQLEACLQQSPRSDEIDGKIWSDCHEGEGSPRFRVAQDGTWIPICPIMK